MAYKQGQSPLEFAQKWQQTNAHPISEYIGSGLSQLELHKGIEPDVVKSLMSEYPNYAPKGAQVVNNAAPAIPAAPDRVSGKVYSLPNGNFRWRDTGWERVQ
jgi:hypothetical protein